MLQSDWPGSDKREISFQDLMSVCLSVSSDSYVLLIFFSVSPDSVPTLLSPRSSAPQLSRADLPTLSVGLRTPPSGLKARLSNPLLTGRNPRGVRVRCDDA